jgi:PAS domain S-box-containing protein
LVAWRSLPNWNVIVSSSVNEDDVIAPWRQSTLIYGLVTIVISGLLGALTWSLLRDRVVLVTTVEERTGALRTTERRLALLVDRAPAAIAMFDMDMHYLAVSRRYLKDYSLTLSGPEALLGRSHYEVFPTIPDHWLEVHRRVLAGETLSANDEPFPREDGRLDWVRWEMAPWYQDNGRPGGAVLFSEVVTARKRAEAEIQETTALLRAIGNTSPDAIYAKDREGRFVFANPAVLAVIGKPADEVIGRTDAEWHHDPEQAAAVMANDRRIVESGQVEVLEETWTAAGLGRRVFRSAKAPLRMEDGRVLGVVAVSSDITPLKDVEASSLSDLTRCGHGR